MSWLYTSPNEEIWNGYLGSRDEAVAEGRANYADGAAFQVAQGSPKAPWPKLFDSWDSIAEFIDDSNEDNSFEDGFCDEAGLSEVELQPLADAINALWATFLNEHTPRSRGLDLSGAEDIPATEEWLERHAKATGDTPA